ncbi:MAG: DUF4430 domain-containing protein, partial [bacterium]
MKNTFKFSFLILLVFVFLSILTVRAYTPLTLISYEISETTISPNNDGIRDTTEIDIKYSEKVHAYINILDAQKNEIRHLYDYITVINPKSKIWDGKNDLKQIVPDGLYTIQILGTSTKDAENTISDTSKTITVDTYVPITLSSITITTPATKLSYTVGDILDIGNLIVTGTYSDGSTKIETITPSDVTGFDSTTPIAGQILTITVGAQTTTYTIDINANTIGNGGSGGSVSKTYLDIKTDVDVPTSCNATDIDGIIHEYPNGNSYLAICALETAIKNASITNVKLSNQYPSLGLFVTSINDVIADPNSQYWAIYQNGNLANSGITSLPVVAGDIIIFQLNDFSDKNLGDKITVNIHSLINNIPAVVIGTGGGCSGGCGGGGIYIQPVFDAQKALTYLKNSQSPDGSFGNSLLYTDWTAIAFGVMNVTDSSYDKIISYFNSHNTLSSLLTDNERHAMSLLALKQNPYSFGNVNYIKAITDSFDGIQFGESTLINDDIFALIPLKNSGYTASDEIIIKDIAFLISKQKENGSWEESVDITSAGIQALKPFESIIGVTESISKATLYLINQQKNDGGWNSVYSTSWVMQAMGALSASWIKGIYTPNNYLGAQQNADGAVLPPYETLQNRIWATSYAIVGNSQKPWSTIMQNFPKPENQNILTNSTPEIKTTTLPSNTTKKVQNPEIKKSKEPISQNLQRAISATALNPDTLSATVINAENTSTPDNTTPFILGFLSGVAVLYLL